MSQMYEHLSTDLNLIADKVSEDPVTLVHEAFAESDIQKLEFAIRLSNRVIGFAYKRLTENTPHEIVDYVESRLDSHHDKQMLGL